MFNIYCPLPHPISVRTGWGYHCCVLVWLLALFAKLNRFFRQKDDSGNGLNILSRITPQERYDPSANGSGNETTQVHRKRKHHKHRKSGSSKRGGIKYKRGGYYNMLFKCLADDPGISMDDRGAKVVTYTCNTKESIPIEFHLPRNSNDILGLSEWNKRTINYLNTHGMALEIFSNQGIINWPVKMNARIFCWNSIFLLHKNFRERI